MAFASLHWLAHKTGEAGILPNKDDGDLSCKMQKDIRDTHTAKMKAELEGLKRHMREDIRKVEDPQFKAMFETSAEVIGGIVKALSDYEKKNEAAWTE